MNILTRFRQRFQRRYDFSGRYAPEPGSGVFRDPRALNTPIGGATLAAEDTPTATMPAPAYEPHGIDTPETLAALREKAEAGARAAQESAQTEQWGTWDAPGTPLAPPAETLPPPPMPPSGLSRAMVSQIPSPPPNDRNFDWTHRYADYMRRVGVATGTSTDLEHTMAWGMPALEPGDGTGVRL